MVIAIDGPAGSGKSTVARLVAEKLGALHLDSGAIYRAVTLLFLREKVDLARCNGDVEAFLDRAEIDLKKDDHGARVLLNGEDVTQEIRSQAVTANVSAVSEIASVRAGVTRKLRELAQNRTVVLDGRDIGTVVFPEAEVKIFLEASLEERARRRFEELRANNIAADFEEIKRDIARRDKHDSGRTLAPLTKAKDAFVLDTTGLSIEEGVNFVLPKVHEKKKSI